MGHILRTDRDDPLRQISFQPDSAYRVPYGKKGRQTTSKLDPPNKKYAYGTVTGHWAYKEEEEQDDIILNCARDRKF